jgi:hypothetical protein
MNNKSFGGVSRRRVSSSDILDEVIATAGFQCYVPGYRLYQNIKGGTTRSGTAFRSSEPANQQNTSQSSDSYISTSTPAVKGKNETQHNICPDITQPDTHNFDFSGPARPGQLRLMVFSPVNSPEKPSASPKNNESVDKDSNNDADELYDSFEDFPGSDYGDHSWNWDNNDDGEKEDNINNKE